MRKQAGCIPLAERLVFKDAPIAFATEFYGQRKSSRRTSGSKCRLTGREGTEEEWQRNEEKEETLRLVRGWQHSTMSPVVKWADRVAEVFGKQEQPENKRDAEGRRGVAAQRKLKSGDQKENKEDELRRSPEEREIAGESEGKGNNYGRVRETREEERLREEREEERRAQEDRERREKEVRAQAERRKEEKRSSLGEREDEGGEREITLEECVGENEKSEEEFFM